MPERVVRRQTKAAVGLQRKQFAWYAEQPSARNDEDPQEVDAARPMGGCAEIKDLFPPEGGALAPGAPLAGPAKDSALLCERKAGGQAQQAFRKMDVLHVFRHGVAVGEDRGERGDT